MLAKMKSRNKKKHFSSMEDIYAPKENTFFMTQVDVPMKRVKTKKKSKLNKVSYLPELIRNGTVRNLKSFKENVDNRPQTVSLVNIK